MPNQNRFNLPDQRVSANDPKTIIDALLELLPASAKGTEVTLTIGNRPFNEDAKSMLTAFVIAVYDINTDDIYFKSNVELMQRALESTQS